jgi:hypothetical protein
MTPTTAQETAVTSKPVAWMDRSKFRLLQKQNGPIGGMLTMLTKHCAFPDDVALYAAPQDDTAAALQELVACHFSVIEHADPEEEARRSHARMAAAWRAGLVAIGWDISRAQALARQEDAAIPDDTAMTALKEAKRVADLEEELFDLRRQHDTLGGLAELQRMRIDELETPTKPQTTYPEMSAQHIASWFDARAWLEMFGPTIADTIRRLAVGGDVWQEAMEYVKPIQAPAQPEQRDAPELSMSMFASRADYEAARHSANTERARSDEKETTGFGAILGTRLRESGSVEWPALAEKESDDTSLLREAMEALEIHHDWCANLQSDYSEVGGDRVAYRATSLTLAKLRERLKEAP